MDHQPINLLPQHGRTH